MTFVTSLGVSPHSISAIGSKANRMWVHVQRARRVTTHTIIFDMTRSASTDIPLCLEPMMVRITHASWRIKPTRRMEAQSTSIKLIICISNTNTFMATATEGLGAMA
jgi:hypothetical protein